MREKSKQKLFTVVLNLPGGATKETNVRASTQEVANKRALKRSPNAVSVRNP